MIENIVESVVAALTASGIQTTSENLIQWIKNANRSVPGQNKKLDSDKIKKLAEDMASKGTLNLGMEFSKGNLARWFEIPEEEFLSTPKSQLEPEVLIRHIALENLFQTWFESWTYEVIIGGDLEGLEDIEIVPDIYAKRITLHGTFEVVVFFVCDNPPSIYRTRALFETFESFAREGAEFGERDILIIATPFKFGKSITQSIKLQNIEEKYTVVALEGDDIERIQRLENFDDKLCELINHVERAQDKLKKKENLLY